MVLGGPVWAQDSIEQEIAGLEPAVSDLEPETTSEQSGTDSDDTAVPVEEPATYAAMDHLMLEQTSIIGNRELPRVLYIVPWKKADIGTLMGRPVNSLLDEVLMPVDRDVFRRHLDFYEELYVYKDDTETTD